MGYHVIADSAFPAAFNCLVPIKGNLTDQDKIHNNLISNQRMKVELAIGHFKGKLAKFSSRITNRETNIYKKLFNSFVVIYKILIDFKTEDAE
ncbi:hypothetical protein ENBRE01_2804 [Enteropsectra breve]|nr:hypothetical protein ENBRE01_2804 [Enteropsectra breve]